MGLLGTPGDSWGILETLEDLLRTSRDSWGPHRYIGVSQESMGFLGTPGDSVEPYMTSWDSWRLFETPEYSLGLLRNPLGTSIESWRFLGTLFGPLGICVLVHRTLKDS